MGGGEKGGGEEREEREQTNNTCLAVWNQTTDIQLGKSQIPAITISFSSQGVILFQKFFLLLISCWTS